MSEFEDLGRSRFYGELSDPRVMDRLLAYTRAEVGGQGEEAQQAFMETIFNRSVARNQPLWKTLSGSYFPDVTHSRAARGVNESVRSQYGPIVQKVLGGSNITNYATGNASGSVGFAGGPQTAAFSGERFGVEGPDQGWWKNIGAEGPRFENLQSKSASLGQKYRNLPFSERFGDWPREDINRLFREEFDRAQPSRALAFNVRAPNIAPWLKF